MAQEANAARANVGTDEIPLDEKQWPVVIGTSWWLAAGIIAVGIGSAVAAAYVYFVLDPEQELPIAYWLAGIALVAIAEGVRRLRWAEVHFLAGPKGVYLPRLNIFFPWSSIEHVRAVQGPRNFDLLVLLTFPRISDAFIVVRIERNLWDDPSARSRIYAAANEIEAYYGTRVVTSEILGEMTIPLYGAVLDAASLEELSKELAQFKSRG